MILPFSQPGRVAIACGGTGGHLFPGLAVAEQLVRRGCAVTLLISPKEVDQNGVKGASGMEVFTLPAVGWQRGARIAFVRGFCQSYRAARRLFKAQGPQAALAMGGFTGAPPILAAKNLGARTFLHESNAVPGRANRWLSWVVDRGFVGFVSAAPRLARCPVVVTGTPVRGRIRTQDAAACRKALGLEPDRPVLLVIGGSQGASAINRLLLEALPLMAQRTPTLQWLHVTGHADAEQARQAYASLNLRAVVCPFLAEMELALGAATAAVSRAGASSLAEFAALRLPALLVPYPAAADNHQFHNARAFQGSGAAIVLEQSRVRPETLAPLVAELMASQRQREDMQKALAQWHHPRAAEQIAEAMLETMHAHAQRPVRDRAGSSNATQGSAQAKQVKAAVELPRIPRRTITT